jgi:hypothetical protein
MRIATLALMALITAACATPSNIEAPLKAMEGKPISDVIRRIGIPHNEQTIAGMRVVSYSYKQMHQSGRDFYCDLKFVVNDAGVVTMSEVKASSMYYCPRLDRD